MNKSMKKNMSRQLKKYTRDEKFFESQEVNSLFLVFVTTFGFSRNKVKSLAEKLKPYSDYERLEMIQQSLDRGWKSLYELRPGRMR